MKQILFGSIEADKVDEVLPEPTEFQTHLQEVLRSSDKYASAMEAIEAAIYRETTALSLERTAAKYLETSRLKLTQNAIDRFAAKKSLPQPITPEAMVEIAFQTAECIERLSVPSGPAVFQSLPPVLERIHKDGRDTANYWAPTDQGFLDMQGLEVDPHFLTGYQFSDIERMGDRARRIFREVRNEISAGAMPYSELLQKISEGNLELQRQGQLIIHYTEVLNAVLQTVEATPDVIQRQIISNDKFHYSVPLHIAGIDSQFTVRLSVESGSDLATEIREAVDSARAELARLAGQVIGQTVYSNGLKQALLGRFDDKQAA